MEEIQVKKISLDYIPLVLNIQAYCYDRSYLEKSGVFSSIIDQFPQGSLGVWFKKQLVGYLFFHPYFSGIVKHLNDSLSLTGKEDCLYIHDMAIDPSHRGKGLTNLLLSRCFKNWNESPFNQIYLVSVQDSTKFWQAKGFELVNSISYGEKPAYFMKKTKKIDTI